MVGLNKSLYLTYINVLENIKIRDDSYYNWLSVVSDNRVVAIYSDYLCYIFGVG